jgi:hypothetical protein
MKLLFYVMSLLIVLMTAIAVQVFENDSFLVIRSIQTHYQVLDGSTLSISLYASQLSESLLASEIDRTRLIGEDITFDVSLEDMKQDHQETYLNRTYFHYELFLILPYFFEEIVIENVYLEITTLMHTHEIRIGNINIIPYESTYAHGWQSIYGIRNDDLMTLDTIIIETEEDLDIFLLEGMSYHVTKHPSHIEIHISTTQMIITNPILIIQTSNGKEMIAGMNFISSKRMLVQTEGFHYVYAVY